MRAFWGLALLVLASPANAEWQFIQSWTDPLQEFETRAATTTNDAGYVLHLYRNPIGRIYALITLPDGTADLVRDGQVATLTPEGFDPKQIEAQGERGRIVEYAISTGRMLRDRLWHGQGETPAFGTFHDLLEAPSLSASLSLTTGDTVETQWRMEGAATPIAQALGISIDGVAAGSEWEDTASQALLAAMTACQFPKLDVLCMQKVSTCSTQISEERDIEAFDACVAEDN